LASLEGFWRCFGGGFVRGGWRRMFQRREEKFVGLEGCERREK
jgi:hypothetical protein